MRLKIDNIHINYITGEGRNSSGIPILFIHGFTGSSNDWKFLMNRLHPSYFPIAIDLVGHGKSDSPDDPNFYTCSTIVKHIDVLMKYLGYDHFILCGYSMGGRAALSYALKYPGNLLALILESSSAGIEDYNEKKDRVEHDFLLAEKIKSNGIDTFLEFWFDQPLFENLKKLKNFEQIKNERKKNNVIGLSNSLMGFSNGLMPSYWSKLKDINFPVLLISGSLDYKYTEISLRMNKMIRNSIHKTVEGAGHNVHLEKPEDFVNLLNTYLSKIIDGKIS
ncbi:2-succinyl-6-hydroxy-2,4-cyclohexadiene-1-carboxylate synthase [Melioribacter sp. OK-6-Me]|uniref:2-succinyl-6-hydroxy-2, 4-cyclohexadiene-1-carboxylate synthase n=1 Tax=unclassified Melioribacter TaxID=2627329 RepID=UPI003EDAC1E0